MPLIPRFLLDHAERTAKERLIYAIRGRSVIEESSSGDVSLKYYPRGDSRELVSLPQSEIAVEHSANDGVGKLAGVMLLGLLLLFPSILISSHHALIGIAPYHHFALQIATYCILFAVSSAYLAWLQSRFKTMDTRWRESIQQLFDGDIKRKMIAIRNSMKAFRHFIKWGRTVNYFFYFSAAAWLAQTAIVATLAMQSDWRRTDTDWTLPEAGLACVAIAIYPVVLFVYGYLGWLYANFRDPTLQLCVMVAEEHNKVVAARTPSVGN